MCCKEDGNDDNNDSVLCQQQAMNAVMLQKASFEPDSNDAY